MVFKSLIHALESTDGYWLQPNHPGDICQLAKDRSELHKVLLVGFEIAAVFFHHVVDCHAFDIIRFKVKHN